MSQKTIIIPKVGFILMMLFLSGCSDQLPQAITFPDRDIVFQANDRKNYAIGFINADGSAPIIFSTGEIRISQPTWSQDRNTIYFRSINRDPGLEFPLAGKIGLLRNQAQSPKWCNDRLADWEVYPIPGEESVLYNIGFEIGILDLRKCRPKEILVDYSKDERQPIFPVSPSLSQDGKHVLFTEIIHTGIKSEHNIFRLDLENKKIQKIGEGMNAVLSPDNQQIAFVTPDGIYRMDFDGGNVEKLVDYHSRGYPDYEQIPPIPYWSPDGQAIVYHKCKIGTTCEAGSDFSIYLYKISNGEEVTLFDGGLYPYWP